jgi:uncharacterized protein YihD (DUF1040 family)
VSSARKMRDDRGRCPRTPEIFRFVPIAWQKDPPIHACQHVCALAREAWKISSDETLCSQLLMTGAEGNLEDAAEEDKALLRSNLSVSAIQWHGDTALAGRRFLLSCYWPKAENLRGLGTESPKDTEAQKPAMSSSSRPRYVQPLATAGVSSRSPALGGESIVIGAIHG